VRRNSITFGLILILVGAILLLRRIHSFRDVGAGSLILIAIGLWLLAQRATAWRWAGRGGFVVPLMLLAIGSVLLLRDLDVLPEDFSVWPVVLIAIGVGVLLAAAPLPGGRTAVTSDSIPLDGASALEVTLRHGAGRLLVEAGAGAGTALQGTFAGRVERSVRRAGEVLQIDLGQRWSGGGPGWVWGEGHRGSLDWTVRLPAGLPITLLSLKTGASRSTLDLKDLAVADLRLETGASQTEVTMPDRGQASARISAGAAQVRIHVPPGVAARISTRGGLNSLRIDQARFPGGGGTHQSADYETASRRVSLDIEAGAADVSVD
jgi:hypothetical protein